MNSAIKKTAWIFCVQYLIMNTRFAYFAKGIANGDKTLDASESQFWNVWKDVSFDSALLALLVAIVFCLICLGQKKHSPPNYLGVAALAILTELSFIVVYLFIVKSLSPASVSLMLIVSHLFSWAILVSFRQLKLSL